MPMERRGRQNLNLATGTHATLCSGTHEDTQDQMQQWLKSRWARIGLRAQNEQAVFDNVLTHVNVDSLREAYTALEGNKAVGVDGISKAEYGKNLEENLSNLAKRVQRGSYRPQPKKEVLIPKASGKTRPIAIACFEDKLVDWVVGKMLNLIFDPLFIRNSFGYRPNKSAGDAIKACYNAICKNVRKQVLEIDFSSFFNTIPHRKLMSVVGKKIKDRRFKGLIGRLLKGGILNKEGEILPNEIGTAQGSISSPILANIYLHEVIDEWFIKRHAKGGNVVVRYADDAVFFFHIKEEAEEFLNELRIRVQEHGLTLNEDKTHNLNMAKNKRTQFNFLGFTFYWGKQGSRRILKVKTQKEKLIKALQEFEQWVKECRNKMKLKDLWDIAKTKIQGHINYYGFNMNALKINHFYQEAIRVLFKWLNRRSQRRSYSWEGFEERLRLLPLMKPLAELKLKQLGWNPYA